jgi:hypothetical protein
MLVVSSSIQGLEIVREYSQERQVLQGECLGSHGEVQVPVMLRVAAVGGTQGHWQAARVEHSGIFQDKVQGLPMGKLVYALGT